jgi:WD40 repeat protein
MILTAFEDEDNFVSGGRDGTIKVWRVNDKGMQCLHTMMEEHIMVRTIRLFEKRDLMISNHLDAKLRFWKLSTGNFLGKLSDKTFGEAMVPLRDPNIFVTALHGEVNVWELEEDFDM